MTEDNSPLRSFMPCTAALLLLVTTGCAPDGQPAHVQAPADTAAGEVVMQLVGANDAALIVPVHINGQGPYDLVLDTGATFTCVTPDVAEELGLSEVRGAVGYGAGVHGAGRVAIVRMDSLRVGAAVAHGMSGCVIDLGALETVGTRVQGLLGLNFLREFDVRLDFGRNVLTLTAP
jgi:predicted aspartyl protease